MCFDKVRYGKYYKVQVADHDIKCYKNLINILDDDDIVSPYQYELYFKKNSKELKVVKKVKFNQSHTYKSEISIGLHTYSNKKIAIQETCGMDVYDAIIPKGTRYYYNPHYHTYVSEKLIVYNKIKNK